MSKLLDIENRIQGRKQQQPPSIPLTPDQMEILQRRNWQGDSIRPAEKVRYLPIIGIVTRKGSDTPVPLIPVQFEGIHSNRNHVRVEEQIFERRTDGKGHFMLLVRYEPKDEERVAQGEVRLSIGGQSRIFKIPTIKYHLDGKREMQEFFGPEKFKAAFHRMGINEFQLLNKQQLTRVAIAKITIH